MNDKITIIACSGHCKDCKWWGSEEYYSRAYNEVDTRKPCGHPKIGIIDEDANFTDGLDSEYTIAETGENFGCIHWEKIAHKT